MKAWCVLVFSALYAAIASLSCGAPPPQSGSVTLRARSTGGSNDESVVRHQLSYSSPVDGISIALEAFPPAKLRGGPDAQTVFGPINSAFHLFIRNTADTERAFSRYWTHYKILIYNSQGRLVTGVKSYGSLEWYETMPEGLRDLCILDTGDILIMPQYAISIPPGELKPGSYSAVARVGFSPSGWVLSPWVRRNGLHIWGPAVLESPPERFRIE